jgi:N-methylhydantoinase A
VAGNMPSDTTRAAQFEMGKCEARILTRAAIGTEPIAGPVLIDEYDTTVVVPPDWSLRRDLETQALVLERESTGG